MLANFYPSLLLSLLNQDGFIIFIEGKKGDGKTNFGVYLMEICKNLKLREKFASNIFVKSEDVKLINNYPSLEYWLQNEKGKKLYILDEAGKHIRKMRFMTEQNVKMFDLLQLIRHYDCGFIGIAPSSSYIDSLFLNTDILDARIRKLNKTLAKITDYTRHEIYYVHDIPKTLIKHNSKDIALFSMKGEVDINRPLETWEKIRNYLLEKKKRKEIKTLLNLRDEEYQREFRKILENASLKSQIICSPDG